MPIPPDIPDIGDVVILQATFTDREGALADPTTVTCKVLDSANAETTVSPSQISTGLYEAEFSPTLSGTHWFRFAGTGAVVAAGEYHFVVARQRVT
jgi:hypothetical protein